MAMRLRMQRISFIWLGCVAISFIIFAYLGYRFISIRQTLLFQAEQNARQETKNASRELNTFINMLKPVAQSIADQIGSTQMSKQQIIELIKKRKPIEVSGLGVAFLPSAFDPETKLFAPYYFETEGKQETIQLENLYDYTAQGTEWFYRPLEEGAGFTEPYYGPASKTIVAEYQVPIYRTDASGKKQAIGVVYANQSVEHLNHVLDTLFLNHTGYWTILTKQGTFLAHPQEQLVHQQVSIFDLAKKLNNSSLEKAAKKILKHKRVFLEYDNEITGAPSWLISEPLEGTDWTIVGIFDKSELNINPNVLRQNLIIPSIGAVFFMIFFTFFIFSLFAGDRVARWWLASGIISFALIGQIIWIWSATYMYPEFRKEKAYFVKNKAELHAYLKEKITSPRYGKKTKPTSSNDQEEAPKDLSLIERTKDALIYGYQDARYIPTGIFVNNLQFVASNQIQVSAYIWQRFTDGLHDMIPRGFILPQSTETKVTEISRIKEGNTETILWEVYAKLGQFLHFAKYPFDTKTLRIQLWHRYIKKNIVLVPDLDSYQLINPRSLPGIDADAYLPGWNIIASNFGYQTVNYSSNFGSYSVGPFGIYKSVDKSDVPELHFDILVTRRLIDTLVSDLLPIAVIAVLLFVILLTSIQQKFAVIGSCASVFFATVFAQVRFRAKIPQAQVVYFESFYFLMYAIILAILVITILQQLNLNFPLIRYRNNIIPKLLYWPLLFASLVSITLWYLY